MTAPAELVALERPHSLRVDERALLEFVIDPFEAMIPDRVARALAPLRFWRRRNGFARRAGGGWQMVDFSGKPL